MRRNSGSTCAMSSSTCASCRRRARSHCPSASQPLHEHGFRRRQQHPAVERQLDLLLGTAGENSRPSAAPPAARRPAARQPHRPSARGSVKPSSSASRPVWPRSRSSATSVNLPSRTCRSAAPTRARLTATTSPTRRARRRRRRPPCRRRAGTADFCCAPRASSAGTSCGSWPARGGVFVSGGGGDGGRPAVPVDDAPSRRTGSRDRAGCPTAASLGRAPGGERRAGARARRSCAPRPRPGTSRPGGRRTRRASALVPRRVRQRVVGHVLRRSRRPRRGPTASAARSSTSGRSSSSG